MVLNRRQGLWVSEDSIGQQASRMAIPISVVASPIIWFSDWRHATGTSEDALLDGASGSRKWDEDGGNDPALIEVISAAGLGFPAGMTNVLRIENAVGSGEDHMLHKTLTHTDWTVPANGESVWHRLYIHNAVSDGFSLGFSHQWQSFNDGTRSDWGVNMVNFAGNAGKWELYYQDVCQDGELYGLWDEGGSDRQLDKDVTYRFEWQLTKDSNSASGCSADNMTLNVRLYNLAGTLLYGNSEFKNNIRTSETIAGNNPFMDLHADAQLLGIMLGQSGASLAGGGGEYIYVGGYAVSRTDWCGAWTAADG